MPFQPEQSISPDRMGAIEIVFIIPDPDLAVRKQVGLLNVMIKYSDESIREKRFDLLDRLQDDAQGRQLLAGLGQLKDYLIDRIESELLP